MIDVSTGARGLANDLDAITDVHDHLRVIADLVERYVPVARRAFYRSKIDDIVRRAADPSLNLAVLGEFSSGKSTFINALVRTRLLKASVVATTASVTRIRKGAALTIAATFTNGLTVRVTADDHVALRNALIALDPAAAAAESLKELLDLLTSSSSVADHVRDIEITLPSEELDDHIVILDTPGINAGAGEAKNHMLVTKGIANDVADCALVLISALSPMSSTLVEFLQTHARSFLHRCMFVITRVDTQDEAEREATRAYVRQKLQETLGLDSPVIVESAAITMLTEAPEGRGEVWAQCASEFLVLEAAILTALRRERTLIIAEHLIRLLQELVAEMERELARRSDDLDAEARLLQKSSVAAIEQVLAALHARSAADVNERARSLRGEMTRQRDAAAGATKEFVFGIIDRAGEGVRNYILDVHPQVANAVEHYGAQYSAAVNREIRDLRARCESISAEFVRQFEDSYRELPSLGVPISAPTFVIAPAPHPSVFRSALDHAAQQGKTDRSRGTTGGVIGGTLSGLAFGWLGMIPGAIIGMIVGSASAGDACGAFLLGIVGCVFGAVLGGLAGIVLAAIAGAKSGAAMARMRGPKLQERQHVLRTHLASDIDAFFNDAQRSFEMHVDTAVRGVVEAFGSAVQHHKSAYGAAVERLRAEHEQKQCAVAQLIASVRADAAELRQRAANLESRRGRLANTRVPA